MVKYCCVSTCSTVWNPYADTSLFSFPWKDDALMQKWLKIIPTNCKITKHSRICSLHFQNESVEQKFGKRTLKKDSIPTIFAKEKKTLQGSNQVSRCDTNREVSYNANEIKIEKPDENMEIEYCENIFEQNDDPLQSTEDSKCIPPLLLLLAPEATGRNMPNEMICTNSNSPHEKEMKSVETQIPPHRLQPSAKEEELRKKIKILQLKLRRRDKKFLEMSQMIKELKHLSTGPDSI